MNVYENIIEDVKAVKVKTNAAGVLEQFKKYLEDIKTKVVHTHTQYKTMLQKFAAAGYTAEYIQEWEEKECGNYESNLLAGIDQVVEPMGADLKALKESVRVRTGDKEVSANNIEYKAMRILRQPHRRKKFRAYFEEYLSAAPIHHVGVSSFQTTWTSEVEREALRGAEKELEYI